MKFCFADSCLILRARCGTAGSRQRRDELEQSVDGSGKKVAVGREGNDGGGDGGKRENGVFDKFDSRVTARGTRREPEKWRVFHSRSR